MTVPFSYKIILQKVGIIKHDAEACVVEENQDKIRPLKISFIYITRIKRFEMM